MKKLTALLLALALCIGLLAGCASGGDDTDTASTPAAQSGSTSTGSTAAPANTDSSDAADAAPVPNSIGQPTTVPLCDSTEELSVWFNWPYGSAHATYFTDWNDCPAYQAVEKATNVHINWVIPSQGSEADTFNLMIASQEYTDMIFSFDSYYTRGVDDAIDNEIILRLNETIDDYMPNFKALMESNSALEKNLKTDMGNIGVLPNLYNEASNPWCGLAIRQDWLDNLGLAMPETYDEVENVLTAFLGIDGVKYGTFLGTDGNMHGSQLVGGFGATNDMMQIDGTACYGPTLPGYRTYLEKMHSWVENGLLNPDFPTYNVLDPAAFYNGEVGYGWAFTQVGNAQSLDGAPSDEAYNLVAAPSPVTKKGDINHFGGEKASMGRGGVITTQCSNLPLAARWLDYCFSDQGGIDLTYGIEGETFEYVNGKPVILCDKVEEMYNNTFSSVGALLRPVNHSGLSVSYSGIFPNDRNPDGSLYNDAMVFWGTTGDNAYLISRYVTLTADESTEYANIMADVKTLTTEITLKIILGQEDISALDTAISQMNAMGLERAVAIQQAALDRYNAR